ncbi:MAG: hypothetical protein ACYC99_17725 [Candidatus Geothermincolia bacterium]
MIKQVSDDLVDAISISRSPHDSLYSVFVETTVELSPIKTFLESIGWSHIDICARDVRDGVGFGNDLANFDFGDDLEPDEVPFNGVRISDPSKQIVLNREAFDRLMLRYFDIMAALVPAREPEALNDSRWQDFLSIIETIRARVHQENR